MMNMSSGQMMAMGLPGVLMGGSAGMPLKPPRWAVPRVYS